MSYTKRMYEELTEKLIDKWVFEIADYNTDIIDDDYWLANIREILRDDMDIVLALEQTQYLCDHWLGGMLLEERLVLLGLDLLDGRYHDGEDMVFPDHVVEYYRMPSSIDEILARMFRSLQESELDKMAETIGGVVE